MTRLTVLSALSSVRITHPTPACSEPALQMFEFLLSVLFAAFLGSWEIALPLRWNYAWSLPFIGGSRWQNPLPWYLWNWPRSRWKGCSFCWRITLTRCCIGDFKLLLSLRLNPPTNGLWPFATPIEDSWIHVYRCKCIILNIHVYWSRMSTGTSIQMHLISSDNVLKLFLSFTLLFFKAKVE